jgi:hypothetical protein
MSNLKAAVGEKEAAAIRKRLQTWAKSQNRTCADCTRSNPTWASVNLGVLVCLECAGRHRSLGTHISKMRSITLDTILPAEALFLMNMTNALANKYWEATLPEAERERAIQSSHFISQKYADRRWALSDNSVPVPSQECVPHTHPWWNGGQQARGEPSAPAASAPEQKPATPVTRQFPTPAPAPAVAPAPVADLIDFGDFSSASEPATVSKSASSDPFGSMGTSSAIDAAVLPAADPFANDFPIQSTTGAGGSQPNLSRLAPDPFARPAAFSSSHSMPDGLQHAQVSSAQQL